MKSEVAKKKENLQILIDVDAVGRAVIPKPIRERLGLISGAKNILIATCTKDSIFLKKYDPSCIFCASTEDLISFNDRKVCKVCLNNLLKNLDSTD